MTRYPCQSIPKQNQSSENLIHQKLSFMMNEPRLVKKKKQKNKRPKITHGIEPPHPEAKSSRPGGPLPNPSWYTLTAQRPEFRLHWGFWVGRVTTAPYPPLRKNLSIINIFTKIMELYRARSRFTFSFLHIAPIYSNDFPTVEWSSTFMFYFKMTGNFIAIPKSGKQYAMQKAAGKERARNTLRLH